ncbi:hypothetical protein AAIH32_02895 [Pseudarthrobacter oxydans]|uniref:hypothetical protein n=1 Tax=Pseudarthrobacter oxydans TaxID=1671 RepID=UPI003D2B7726
MEDKRKQARSKGQFIGSAAVVGASYGQGTTHLQLQAFTGEYIDYPIDAVPDPLGAAELRRKNFRPISVKIQDGGERCSMIALTSDGTRRASVTLGTALALYCSGVHTTVEGGLPAEVSCSKPQRPRSSAGRLKPLGADALTKRQ